MLYIIGDIVPFEICNMLPLTVAIVSEEVIEKSQKTVVKVIRIIPLGLKTKRKLLQMLPRPLPQRGEILSKLIASSAVKK